MKSILLVEDEKEMRATLREILEMNSYKVLEAGTYSNAVKHLESDIDLALVDYRLPDCDGIELLKRIRKDKPALPVIILTGYGTEDVAVKSFRTGAEDYIKKPFAIPYLLKKIAGILGEEFGGEDSGHECGSNMETFMMEGIAMHMEENYMQDLNLDKLADMAGMCKFSFCRQFRKKFGHGYVAHLNGIRIKRSKELLGNPDLSISDIAYTAGYKSLSQFERVFKSAEGVAPRDYRKNISVKRV